jgi:hypothetical protein
MFYCHNGGEAKMMIRLFFNRVQSFLAFKDYKIKKIFGVLSIMSISILLLISFQNCSQSQVGELKLSSESTCGHNFTQFSRPIIGDPNVFSGTNHSLAIKGSCTGTVANVQLYGPDQKTLLLTIPCNEGLIDGKYVLSPSTISSRVNDLLTLYTLVIPKGSASVNGSALPESAPNATATPEPASGITSCKESLTAFEISVDILPPVVDIRVNSINESDSVIQGLGSCSENDRNVEVQLKSSNSPDTILETKIVACHLNAFLAEFPRTLLAAGSYILKASQTDTVGLEGHKETQFTINDYVPPPVVLTPTPVAKLPELSCDLNEISNITNSGHYECNTTSCTKASSPNAISRSLGSQSVLTLGGTELVGMTGAIEKAFWCLKTADNTKSTSGIFNGVTTASQLVGKQLPLFCGIQNLKLVSQLDSTSYQVNQVSISRPDCDQVMHVRLDWGANAYDLDLHLVKRYGAFYGYNYFDTDCFFSNPNQDWSPLESTRGDCKLDIDNTDDNGIENIYLNGNSGAAMENIYDIYIEYYGEGAAASPRVSITFDGVNITKTINNLTPKQVWYVGRVNVNTRTLQTPSASMAVTNCSLSPHKACSQTLRTRFPW